MKTLGPESRIKRLENGGASADGLRVMFDIITTDDKSHPFWLTDSDLGKFIAYVLGLSQDAAGVSGKISVPGGPETITAQPIDVLITPGRVETEGILAVHLGPIALTFALSANTLEQLRVQLGRILRRTERPKLN